MPAPAAPPPDIHAAVLAAIASIAPECDLTALRADRPLREQIDLDSLDWLNVLAELHKRVGVPIAAADATLLATIDSLVAYLAARRSEAASGTAPPLAGGLAFPPRPPPASFRVSVANTALTLRPIRADDAALEAVFVRGLSADSRYMRFMATARELSAPKLHELTDVDQRQHVALVATEAGDGGEAFAGVARYIVDRSGTGCEFAVTVGDAWQGSGLAGILMQALIERARAQGLARMEGIVLSTNTRMLKLARQLGFSAQRDPDDPRTVHVVLGL
jgi:RimJ/RimL family protein N-acetyltransferase/acyl carrier protein